MVSTNIPIFSCIKKMESLARLVREIFPLEMGGVASVLLSN